ncbi:metalloregulator ArsR/SmtB family transcription factor [Streptosporangium sp. NPDC023963]|uniref:ArsR/SmtB family transcription factor n=1 Tax=Streptosporangium sp. NPDC023963 TaxID=3155608 RepID=UPI00344666A0
MHVFDILGDPVRRRVLEPPADGERTSGAITDVIRAGFAIPQPAVSRHLRVLRDSGFASVRARGKPTRQAGSGTDTGKTDPPPTEV